jgi:hypothetical protein
MEHILAQSMSIKTSLDSRVPVAHACNPVILATQEAEIRWIEV